MSKIRTAPRTQDEILARISEAANRDPLLLTEAMDLVGALHAHNLTECDLLDQEKVAQMNLDDWHPVTPARARDEAVAYMEFALDKAHGQRGLSAGRSLAHYAAWLWLCLEDEDYAEFEDWENYTNYGLAELGIAARLLGMEE